MQHGWVGSSVCPAHGPLGLLHTCAETHLANTAAGEVPLRIMEPWLPADNLPEQFALTAMGRLEAQVCPPWPWLETCPVLTEARGYKSSVVNKEPWCPHAEASVDVSDHTLPGLGTHYFPGHWTG